MKLISKAFIATVLLVIAASCDGNVSKKHGDNGRNTEATASVESDQANPSNDSSGDSSIIGKWVMSNAPGGGDISIDFQSNGTFRLIMSNMRSSRKNKTIQGQWSENGTNVYLSAEGESRVQVMEILSLDGSSLVVHFKGNSEKEIDYFVRSN